MGDSFEDDNFKADCVYDLKACADDKTLVKNNKKVQVVHKRIWNILMWGGTCCWTPERVTYYAGKQSARNLRLSLPADERQKVMQAIRRDTEWLQGHNLMDYSLLVAIRNGPPDSQADSLIGRKPIRCPAQDGSERAMYVSIIDFLQEYNRKKKIAHYIKALERNKSTVPPTEYGERF